MSNEVQFYNRVSRTRKLVFDHKSPYHSFTMLSQPSLSAGSALTSASSHRPQTCPL